MAGWNAFPRARGHQFQEEQNEFTEAGPGSGLRGPAGTATGQRAFNAYRGADAGNLKEPDNPVIRQLLRAVQRKAWFQQVFFDYTTAPVLVLPQAERTYFLVQNLSSAETIYIGLGIVPGVMRGLEIQPQGYYEPYQVPQNDIYIVGTGAGTVGVIYANVN